MVAPLFKKPRTYNIEGGVASEVGLRRAICPVHSGAMALRCPGNEMTRATKKCTSLIYKSEYYKCGRTVRARLWTQTRSLRVQGWPLRCSDVSVVRWDVAAVLRAGYLIRRLFLSIGILWLFRRRRNSEDNGSDPHRRKINESEAERRPTHRRAAISSWLPVVRQRRHSNPASPGLVDASAAYRTRFYIHQLRPSQIPSALKPHHNAFLRLHLYRPVVSGTPLARQAQALYNPNFEGAGDSIILGSNEWGVSPAVAGTVLDRTPGLGSGLPLNRMAKWHVEQTGEINQRPRGRHQRGQAVGPRRVDPTKAYVLLILLLLVPESEHMLTRLNIRTQIWEINCRACLPDASTPDGGEFGTGCKIVSAVSGLCVKVEPAGVTMGMEECATTAFQSWGFWTATAESSCNRKVQSSWVLYVLKLLPNLSYVNLKLRSLKPELL
ncbi:hypothetical protein DFH08DRAFT_817202 [Mycena albidolilacea]|uniref:Uncharacterized protein n=1 Tax=Mycena albidolilacea TaxID=1033008 RepID=A0AAD7EHX3_9AGAR|nr:hypothetical protein DFH08DRAFT_817202 [Mycena albidolilacea]